MFSEPGPQAVPYSCSESPLGKHTVRLRSVLCSVPHCRALQPGQAPVPAVTTGLGTRGSEQTLFANFVYCLIRKTWPALSNSGSGHIWGKGLTWIQSRMRFGAVI